MRVFVTGASGFVGSAITRELVAHGHEVVGLARSAEAARKVEAAGGVARRGGVGDLALLSEAAAAADGVIHTAFNHDFSKFAANCAEDEQAILALGAGLQGTQKPLLVTGGLAALNPGGVATEADQPGPQFPRLSDRTAQVLAAQGLRAGCVRLAPSVHDRGDHGFIPMLIGIARDKGVSAYVGTGENRWPGVHRGDAARVYRLALEQGVPAPVFHAVGEEGIAFRDIATVIGEGLGLPVQSVAPEAAAAHFGFMGMFAGMDLRSSSAATQARLGWTPTGPGLLEDIRNAGYLDV